MCRTMGAATRLELSPGERRALALLAVLVGTIGILSTIGITSLVLAFAADEDEDPLYRPRELWAAVATVCALAPVAVGWRLTRRGWRGVASREPDPRIGRALWGTSAVWLVWSASAAPYFSLLAGLGVLCTLTGLLGLLVANRAVVAVRALLDSRG